MTSYKGQITGLASPFLESYRMNIIKKFVTGGTILDFGCGTGKFAELLSFDHYTGVDIDRDSISTAKAHYTHDKNVDFITFDEFSHTKTTFDCIILSAVIEHFDNPYENVKNLSERLNPQGKIIITTPTWWGNKILAVGSRLGIFSKVGYEEHKNIFSKKDFVRLADLLHIQLQQYRTFECGLNQFVILSK